MGKEIPRSFEKIRSGEQIQYPTFTNVAAAVSGRRERRRSSRGASFT